MSIYPTGWTPELSEDEKAHNEIKSVLDHLISEPESEYWTNRFKALMNVPEVNEHIAIMYADFDWQDKAFMLDKILHAPEGCGNQDVPDLLAGMR